MRVASGPSRLYLEFIALDLHRTGTHRPLRRPANYRARGRIELAAMTRTRHGRIFELTFAERAPHVCASVIESIETSSNSGDADLSSVDIEDAHFAFSELASGTHSYHRHSPPKLMHCECRSTKSLHPGSTDRYWRAVVAPRAMNRL